MALPGRVPLLDGRVGVRPAAQSIQRVFMELLDQIWLYLQPTL